MILVLGRDQAFSLNLTILLVYSLVHGNLLLVHFNGGGKMALTELEVKHAKPTDKPYKLTDGGGLFLLVNSNGGKYWRLAYRFAGKQKTLSLGTYPVVGIADARSRREQLENYLLTVSTPAW